MNKKLALLLSCLMLASACKDITHVQTGYIADRDECRANAESNASVYSPADAYAISDKDKNVALLQLFCECMKGKDWNVAGCPKKATMVAQTPAPAPTVVVVQQPTAQPALLPVAQTPEPAAPVVAKKKKKRAVCTPPNTCPAPPDVTATTPQNPAQSDQQLQNVLQQ